MYVSVWENDHTPHLNYYLSQKSPCEFSLRFSSTQHDVHFLNNSPVWSEIDNKLGFVFGYFKTAHHKPMGDVTAVKTLMRLRCVKLVHFVFKMLYKSTQSIVRIFVEVWRFDFTHNHPILRQVQLNIFSRVEGPIYAIVYYHYKLVKHWCFCLVVGPDLPTQSISTRRPGLFPLTLHVLVSFLKLAFFSVNTTSDIKVPKRTKKAPKPASTKQQQSHLRPKHYLNCIWLQRLHHSPTASFECAFQISRLHLFICKIAYACVHVSGPQSVQTDDGDDETVGCVVVESLSAWPRRPPASSPPSLCSHPSSIDHVAHYKSTVSWATLQVP